MAINTQDFVKGIDITGLSNVSGSELNQLVDVSRFANNKGGIIETTDTAVDIPDVPNPNGNYSGILPVWWKRYIWRRLPFAGEDTEVKLYKWDENAIEDGILLFWIQIDHKGEEALALANIAITDSATAQATANTALSNAAIAQSGVDDNTEDITTLNTTTAAQAALITALQASVATIFSAGDLRYTCRTTGYSTIVNQGWLFCDGSLVDRTVFATLFAEIGTTFGAGDGVTTFAIPDFRGRVLMNSGQGAGLTLRNLGVQNIGTESVLLSALESGLPSHKHTTTIPKFSPPGDGTSGGGAAWVIPDGTLNVDSANVAAAPAANAHNNIQPSAVVNILIKT